MTGNAQIILIKTKVRKCTCFYRLCIQIIKYKVTYNLSKCNSNTTLQLNVISKDRGK